MNLPLQIFSLKITINICIDEANSVKTTKNYARFIRTINMITLH